MPGFSADSYDTIIPRTFKMKRVEIDPKLLEETKPKEQQKRGPQPITLAREKPLSEANKNLEKTAALLAKPDAYPTDQFQGILPQVMGSVQEGNVMEAPQTLELEGVIKEPKGIENMSGSDEVPNKGGGIQPKEEMAEMSRVGANEKAGFSNLDQLLLGNEAINEKTAPILMPTDLLFEYDSATLKPAATESLNKLGALIEKNAQAVFRIEGHTDSFGSDEYNQVLSMKRAEAVKTWLKQKMNIGDEKISTLGLGKSRLLFPATGTVMEQQLNRRVEIVISTK